MAERAGKATMWGAAVIVALLAGASPAAACLACIAMPTESLSDKATAAEVVALLRPAPDDPFRYEPVGFLKGGSVAVPVPFLVSRARAAELAVDPDATVVATWSTAAGWAIHDLGTPALSDTLTDLLTRDLATPEARRDAFGPLVGHADPAVARMAMVELASLPYAVLRTTSARMDRREVARAVADPLWSEWAPVMILVLGLSADEADRAFVRRATTLAAEAGRSAHLAAWSTARIEVDGIAGVDWVVATYITDPARKEAERSAAILALASHAARDDAAGAAIREALAALAAAHPGLAAALARIMTERQDWSLAANAAQWLAAGQGVSPDDAFVLTSYVLAAGAAQRETPP